MKDFHPASSIKISIISCGELTDRQRSQWETLRSQGVFLDSPFFSPQFFQLVSSVRPQTRVAVISCKDQVVGFWPFEAVGRSGRPAAPLVTEISGVIAADGFDWNPKQHLSSLGLTSWSYDCIPAGQAAFRPYEICRTSSAYISLGDGFQRYCDQLNAGKSRQLEQNARKIRRIERDHGPLRWVWHDPQPRLLEQLFRWKRDQYRRTGVTDVLGVPWVRGLLKGVYDHQSPTFSGVLSTLYLGERPIAVHFGIRDRDVLSGWFPAYDPQFSIYSPGTILLLKIIEEATRQGIARIDLGQGDERYKSNFGNGSFVVAEGTVHGRPWHRLGHAAWVRARHIAQTNRHCERPLRWFRGFRNRLHGVEKHLGEQAE